MQGVLVEVERVRRWVDPRHSARVVWALVIAGIVLAFMPYIRTVAYAVFVVQLYRVLLGNGGGSADPTKLAKAEAGDDVSLGPSADDANDGATMRMAASRAGTDLWVLVSGGSASSADDTGVQPATATDAAPKHANTFQSRIRDMLHESMDRRKGGGVRCKSCNQLVDTLFKRKCVCSKCDMTFCTTCCAVPRKGNPRLCKGCAAT